MTTVSTSPGVGCETIVLSDIPYTETEIANERQQAICNEENKICQDFDPIKEKFKESKKYSRRNNQKLSEQYDTTIQVCGWEGRGGEGRLW